MKPGSYTLIYRWLEDDGVMENPWESMLCMYSGLSWALAKPVPIVDSPQSEAEAMVKIGTGTRDPPHLLIATITLFSLEFHRSPT